MNRHNALLYEVKRRGRLLEDHQLRLQNLMALETASPEALIQLQVMGGAEGMAGGSPGREAAGLIRGRHGPGHLRPLAAPWLTWASAADHPSAGEQH